MLIVALYSVVLLWLLAHIGKAVLALTHWENEAKSLGLAALVGLVAVASAVQLWHLAFPVYPWLSAGVIGLSLLCFLWVHLKRRHPLGHWWPSLSYAAWALLLLLMVTLFGKGASFSEIFDEGAYHIPISLLAASYRLIPGVAHVHSHFGLETAWHECHSLLYWQADWAGRLRLNPMLLLAFGLYALESLPRKTADWQPLDGLLVLGLGFVFRNILTSTGNDLSAIYLGIAGLVLLLRWYKMPTPHPHQWLIPIGLLFGSLICKVSHLALGLLPLGLLAQFVWQRQWRNAYFLAGLALLMLVPFFVRNVILSGYLLIPVKATALPVDWAFPAFRMRVISNPAHYGLPEDIDKTSWAYLAHWLSGYHLVEKLIFLLLPFATLGWVWACIKGTLTPMAPMATRLCFAGLPLLGIGVWYFTVPEFRYGMGILLPVLVIGLGHWVSVIRLLSAIWARGLVILAVLMVGLGSYKTLREITYPALPRLATRLLTLPVLPKVESTPQAAGNFSYQFPHAYHEDLSALPYPTPTYFWTLQFPTGLDTNYLPYVYQRGASIEDGFRYQGPIPTDTSQDSH